MTIASGAAEQMISRFGEEVTIYPKPERQAEDSSNPIYIEQSETSPSSFTQKVRLYTTPSVETLQSYGFEEDSESLIYTTEDVIEQGDAVEYNGMRYIVRNTATNQHGNGTYIWIHDLVGE